MQQLAADSQERVAKTPPYGSAMLTELDARLRVRTLPRSYPFPLEDALLRGLAYQMTDECEVWWSPEEALDA